MATQMTPQMLARLTAEHFNVDQAEALKVWSKVIEEQPKQFSSKAAENLYKELKPTGIVATGRGGKISIDDVRAAAGIETKRKAPSEFSHHTAKTLAVTKGLTPSDFPDEKRTGTGTQSPLASGCAKRITISDVRRLMVEKEIADQDDTNALFTSPGVAKAARDAGLSPSDFAIKSGKISKADVESLKQLRTPKPVVATEENFEELEEEEEDLEEEDLEEEEDSLI